MTKKDRERLRELAKTQAELATSERMETLRRLWLSHNMRRGERPMITVEIDTFAEDVLPPLLRCEGQAARQIEYELLKSIANALYLKDDTIVEPYYGVRHYAPFTPFGIDVKVEHSKESGGLGHHFIEQIADLERDFERLKSSTFCCKDGEMTGYLQQVTEAIGDILPVKYEGGSVYSCLTQDLVHIMGMENMFLNLYDYPELFQKMLEMLTSDYIRFYRFLEKEGLLLPTTRGERVSQGTYAYTDELSDSLSEYTTRDIWGFMDSQETVGVAPEMFKEVFFPHYERLSKEYGLLSYGCCEPTDPIWDSCVSKFSNLRKVSVSPWANQKFLGERLQNGKVIFHRKPSPNYLSIGKNLDEAAVRAHIKETVDSARGCKIEFTQRDVYTVGGSLEKAARYVQLIREESENAYR